MRVALVCPYDWAAHGGVRAHVAALAETLASEHEVRVVAPATAERPDAADAADAATADGRALDGHAGGGSAPELVSAGRPHSVRINDSVARVALGPAAARRTVRLLDAWQPDVVHVHEPLAPAVSLAASTRGPRPVVGTFHAWSTSELPYRAVAPAARRVARRLDVRLAVSPAAARYAAGALRVDEGEFEVVPNGVDAERLARALPREDLADPERPLVVFVGRLEQRKGVVVLVRAFNLLQRTHPATRLLVVGDGPERRRAEALVSDEATEQVHFAGAVDEQEKARLLASADVFAAPALGGESFGIVLLEAMAAGLPVVASDLPGFRAVCRDDREGVITPPGQPTQLAAALASLLDDPRRRKRFVAAGRERAWEHSWPRIAERIVEVYERARWSSPTA